MAAEDALGELHELPELKKVNWFSAVKQTIQEFMADDAMGVGAEMAYRFLFALFPTLLVVLSLLGILDGVFRDANFSGQLLDMLRQALPATAYSSIEPVIQSTVEKASGAGAFLGIGFLLSFLVALWSASGGTEALMKGFNVAYDVEETRNFIKKKLTAIALTIGMVVFVAIAMALLVYGGKLGEAIANAVGLGALFHVAWNVGRIVLVLIFLIVGLAVLYYAAPNVNHKFVWISPGSIVAGILWLFFTWVFSIYMNNWGGMSSYGVVGGVMALVLWMYYSNLVLLLGAEMNGVLGQRHDPTMIDDPRQKATGPQAQTTVSGGRAIGAGANQAKGTVQPEVRPLGTKAHQGGRQGRHRAPEDEAVDRRLRTGRQDPERVGGGRHKPDKRQNGRSLAPLRGTNQGTDPEPEAPAKHFLWNVMHRGSKDLAVHGTRQVLSGAWRTVFNTRPPGEKRPKK